MTAARGFSTGKALSQRDQILQLLRERGPAGATNIELNAIAFRYGGRIHELRRMGHKIRTENLGDGRFRFVLEPRPSTPKLQSNSAGQRPGSAQRELFVEAYA